MEYLSEMLLFSFPNEYIQILNCVHNSPSEKQCCLKMPLLCFDSMHIQAEKRNVNSVCLGREEAKSSHREALSLAGRQGGLLGSPGQLSCGESSLFLVKS